MVKKFSTLVQELGDTVVKSCSLEVNPELDPDIVGIAAITQVSPGNLSYIEGRKYAAAIATTPASTLILPQDESLQAQATQRGIAWIGTSQPRLAFARAIALFYTPWKPAPEIHPTAVIAPDAQLGENIYIGAHAVIQAGVKLGNQVCVHPNVVIYPEVHIGDRTLLHANCTIHERSQIGADCVIHSGAVIGAEGFGFVPTPQGWFKMEQSGYTILEDGVEIGCNSTVDRPAVGETRIGRNTKIDNLVHIAHSCKLGENCALAAQVGMAGGVSVGNNVLLAGQVGIANQAHIGDGAIVTAQSGVLKDVEPGDVVSGYPAVPKQLWLRVSAIYQYIPEMYRLFRQLRGGKL